MTSDHPQGRARPNILETMLAAAIQDQRTVDEQRQSIAPLVDGMSFHDSIRHNDDRGSVTEIYDPRWGWHPDPLVSPMFSQFARAW